MTSNTTSHAAAALATFALTLIATVLWVAGPADALPVYSARAGRTCDNCHTLPNTWYNPPEVLSRKCTLSCMACHVDPNGGGLRTVSGRYFGKNTLPMFGSPDRPLDDKDPKELEAFIEKVRAQRGGEAGPGSGPTSGPAKPDSAPSSDQGADPGFVIPDRPVDPRPEGSPLPNDGPVFFRPLLHGSSEMAWLDGRYGDLNADPLVQLGGDARLAIWNPGLLIFPMQADFHLALHPVEHLTISSTTGLTGKSGAVADEDLPLAVRDLWAMTHEWPGLSYARVGRFMPAFGSRVADHTSYIRRGFDLTQEDPTDRVIGAEVGFAANYPYFNAAGFLTSKASLNPFETGEGEGFSFNAGWRDLGWQLGASFMHRLRPLDEGGDTLDISLQWAFNPWFYWKNLPLTYLGELTAGQRERLLSGNETNQLASYHELAWSLKPGLILRARYDFWDPDQEVKEDEVHRPGLGVDWTILEGLTIGLDARFTAPVGGEPNPDGILQIHGWF